MRKVITLLDGRKFFLSSFTGVVVEARKWSETEVWSSHTPSQNGPQQQINSATYQQNECWLRAADGEESEHHFFPGAPSYRSGHIMSVVIGGLEGNRRGEVWATKNHKTGEESRWLSRQSGIQQANRGGLLAPLDNAAQRLRGYALLFLVVGISALMLTGSSLIDIFPLVLLFAVPAYAMWAFLTHRKGMRNLDALFKQINAEIDTTFKPHTEAEALKLEQSRSAPVDASAPSASSY